MIKVNGDIIKSEFYPDGTTRLHVNIPLTEHVNIEWLYEPNEEMLLLYVVNHIRNSVRPGRIDLYMPYIPNARMDRTKGETEVFTLKHLCGFINSLNFENVIVRDPHSHVSTALLDRVICEDVNQYIQQAVDIASDGAINFRMCYPDEGAVKRYSDAFKIPYLYGIKNRCWETGEILSLKMHGNIPSEPFDVLLVDDISSYGGTFFFSATELKKLGARNIYLYVTHCESSVMQGKLPDSGLIKQVFTTRSIFPDKMVKLYGGWVQILE